MKNTLPILMLFLLMPLSMRAQWMKTNALPGGNVHGFLNHGDTVLAGIGSEAYFSTNRGKSWIPVAAAPVNVFRLRDSDGHSVLFIGHDPFEEKYRWYRSDDFFQTAVPVLPADTMPFYEMIFAFSHIYSYGNNGVYRTNDNGANWEYLTSQRIESIKLKGTKLFAFNGNNQMLCSDDEGNTWDTLLTTNGFIRDYIIPDHRTFVFTDQGCHVSDNGGQSWQYYPNSIFSDHNFKFVWHNGVIFGANYEVLIKSTDLGQTWTTVNLPSTLAYPASAIVSSGNAVMIGGAQYVNSPGMHRSIDNGITWTPVSMGIRAAVGKFRKTGNDLLIAGSDGVYRRDVNSEIWVKEPINIPELSGNYWGIFDYVEINDHKIISTWYAPWVSTNGGFFWANSQFSNPLPWDQDEITQMEIIEDKVLGWGFAGGHANQYYTSEDEGLSFERLNLSNIFAMDIDSQRAFALHSNGTIYRSDDACETWQIHSQSLPKDSCNTWFPYESRLIVRGNVFIAYAEIGSTFLFMHISLDGAQNWSSYCQEDNLSSLPWGNSEIRDIALVGNKLVAATQKGIYVSENGVQDWLARNEGLWQVNIRDLIVHDGYLWAAATNGGVWRRPVSELELHVESETRAEKENWNDALKIYPNPAAERLFVEGNKEAGAIEIRDMTGRLLVQKNINTGINPLEITSFKPGVYQLIFVGQSGGRVVRKVAIL
ncbi:MAG: T9SS type A sorting domain-containing protein [Saprospiraceae bacterium]|nr:T9SS type A sorting domain-containing protein [Saprospiraceae bacterium]